MPKVQKSQPEKKNNIDKKQKITCRRYLNAFPDQNAINLSIQELTEAKKILIGNRSAIYS